MPTKRGNIRLIWIWVDGRRSHSAVFLISLSNYPQNTKDKKKKVRSMIRTRATQREEEVRRRFKFTVFANIAIFFQISRLKRTKYERLAKKFIQVARAKNQSLSRKREIYARQRELNANSLRLCCSPPSSRNSIACSIIKANFTFETRWIIYILSELWSFQLTFYYP